ncbi:50S ribosomal protein L1 [compost metagenome]
MGDAKLKDNFLTLMSAVVKAKPASSKGVYIKSISVASTMGPGVKMEPNQAAAAEVD